MSSLFKRLSSFSKIIRVVAYCRRFIDIKINKLHLKGFLSPNELKRATIRVIKFAQRETFSEEVRKLESKKQIDGKLTPLNPFLDSEAVLRVGGRLSRSDLTYQKHPILLSKNHNLTNLIIREEHLKLYHAGTQATLNAVRNKYWIVNGKNTVKILSAIVSLAFARNHNFPRT